MKTKSFNEKPFNPNNKNTYCFIRLNAWLGSMLPSNRSIAIILPTEADEGKETIEIMVFVKEKGDFADESLILSTRDLKITSTANSYLLRHSKKASPRAMRRLIKNMGN